MKVKVTDLLNFIASNLGFTPAGNISATNTQAAIEELDDEKVAKAGDTMTGQLNILTANLSVVGDGGAHGMEAFRYQDNTGAPFITLKKSRGSVATPTNVNGSDQAGQINMRVRVSSTGGPDNDGFYNVANIRGFVIAATPSTTDTEGQIQFLLTPPGSTTTTEILRFEHATGMSMYGANPVIDQNRHHQLRSYTVAGLPSAATAGQMIYVSNESGGAVPAFSDGTNWRRVTDRAIVS